MQLLVITHKESDPLRIRTDIDYIVTDIFQSDLITLQKRLPNALTVNFYVTKPREMR